MKRKLSAASSDAARQTPGHETLVDMAEAVRLLKTTRPTFYRWVRAGRIPGHKVGRQWRFQKADIERFLKGEEPRVDLRADIAPLVAVLRARAAAAWEPSPKDGEGDVDYVIRLMVAAAVASRASDVHMDALLDTAAGGPQGSLRFRIDGALQSIAVFDIRLLPPLVAAAKRLAGCDVHERIRPQDGRMIMDVPEAAGQAARKIDLRVSFLPATLGEGVTMRLLDRSSVFVDLDRIDYSAADRLRIERALALPWGLVIVSGPTGSGKTTTLYSMLARVATPDAKVIAIEEPVEFLLPGISQVQVQTSAGLTFTRAMRSALRSDPDVIMLGEIRDAETLMVACEAAITGHLVLTTLHTDGAAEGLRRLVDIGLDAFLVGDAVKLVMAQRLVRRLCPECSRPDEPEAAMIEFARRACETGGLDWASLDKEWRRQVGCGRCGGTGYRGRTVISETLEMCPELVRALRDGAGAAEVRGLAVRRGMTTMRADGVRLAAAGKTTLAEVMRVVPME